MDLSEFERRIEEARNDPVALKEIAGELLSNGDRSSRGLGIKALAIRAKVLNILKEENQLSTPEPPKPPGSDWLAQLGLPRPDARPLSRYKLSAAIFSPLQDSLEGRSPSMQQIERA